MTETFLPWPGTGPFLDVDRDLSWEDKALCAEVWPDAFFPDRSGSVVYAKRICALCEVRDECLAYALAHSQDPEDVGNWGVWGGTSEEERRRMLGLRRPKDATAA